MDPKELRGLVEAYSQMYAPQQIDEISQKTATSAYAKRRTGEFEGDDASDRVAKTNKLKDRIEKKFGKEAGKHADRAADVETFGRKDASGRRKQSPQPRIQTSDHENQREFKRELRIKRDRRLRAARGEDTNEQVNIFDVVLEFLQVEGYAETLEEAEWMMANMIDEEAIDIILEITGGKGHPGYKAGSKDHGPMQSGHPADSEKRKDKGGTMSQRHGYHLGDIDDDDDDEDELESVVKQQSRDKRETVRKPLRNKVKAARKVLSKEEYVDEADSLAAMQARREKRLAAQRKREGTTSTGRDFGRDDRLSATQQKERRDAEYKAGTKKEEFEFWVDSLVEEGYDLSDYTWDEMYEFYLDEDAGIISGLAGLALGAKGASYAAKHTKRMRDYPKNFVKGIVDPRTYGSKKKKEQKEEFVGEAQHARENPEKYEREQSKKYAPVRGEKTPMPPRGDKRREDFEKWYRANVR